MGKKIFSLCMALVLCLGLLPATALAAAPNGQVIYVGNVNVTNGGYWTIDSDGNVTASTAGDTLTENYIHYDAGDNTLTLHNATIKKGLDYNESIQGGTYILGSAIGVFNQNGDAELTITLEGTNTIEDVSTGIFVLAHSSSTGDASLTITGSGSLTASGDINGINVQSNGGDATLTIQSADVTLTSNPGNGVTVQAGSTNSSGGHTITLSVEGGSLTASGSTGISFDSASSNTVSATNLTVSNNAIVRANDVGSNISNVDLQIGKGNNSSGGIVFDGNQGTVYGDVTLEEDLTIGEGESLTIGKDASLTVPDGKTLTNNGTINNSGTLTNNGTVTNNGTLNVNEGGNLGGTPTGGSGTVVNAPAITAQPADTTVTEGQTASFTVTATGENPTYQWQQKTTDSGSDWTNVGSATSSNTYTIDNTTTSMSGYQYRCVVSNSAGSVTSDAATLTVTALPEPEPEPEPTPPPYIPPTYAVTAPETTGGTVTVSPSRASRGRTVTITATPDLGFALESLTVLDSRGKEITLTDKGDGKYTFTMPASRVTVEASFAPAPLPFEDVPAGAWYEQAVRYVYLHDIMEGMSATTFQPNGTLTRAQAVQIFYNLEGQPDISSENLGYPYEDVNAQAWYGDAVYWARLTGVATGYGDGTFQPTDSITRQEFAQMLYNYAKYKGYDLTAEGDLSQFPDSNTVADWAEAAMIWANGNELINGHDNGTIDAVGIGTRAQAASILMRFDQNLVEK